MKKKKENVCCEKSVQSRSEKELKSAMNGIQPDNQRQESFSDEQLFAHLKCEVSESVVITLVIIYCSL